jgi:hypothetical protein
MIPLFRGSVKPLGVVAGERRSAIYRLSPRLLIGVVDVRIHAHNGLKSDIAACLKGADSVL